MKAKSIVIEGIIGAGKTVFARELADCLGITEPTIMLLEPDEKNNANPYLASYYKDPEKFAFVMQIHLLQARYRQHQQAGWCVLNNSSHAIVDRSIYGDTCFAHIQRDLGYMSEDEFATYRGLFHAMTANMLLPNFCIRLLVRPETAKERLSRRMTVETGRACESNIELQYLQKLDKQIEYMTNILRSQGVYILEVPWDIDRSNAESRQDAIAMIAQMISSKKPNQDMLEFYNITH